MSRVNEALKQVTTWFYFYTKLLSWKSKLMIWNYITGSTNIGWHPWHIANSDVIEMLSNSNIVQIFYI